MNSNLIHTLPSVGGASETEAHEFPLRLHMLPPPEPFNQETALRWLREEAGALILACSWGLVNTDDEPTRDSFTLLLGEVKDLIQAAAEIATDGKPKRPVVLDTNPINGGEAIMNLMCCVRSALTDNAPRAIDMQPCWFGALAEILEKHIRIEHEFKGDAHMDAIERFAFPMRYPDAASESVGAA